MINKVEIASVDTAKLPVLSNEEKQELLIKIKNGDEIAREKFINGNELLVMLDLNEGELKKMPKSDKISEKYIESVTIVNNDPFFQEYMSHEED